MENKTTFEVRNNNVVMTNAKGESITSSVKEYREYTESIGHALTAEQKFSAAAALKKSTTTETVRELMAAYMGGNVKPLASKNLKEHHADNGTAEDNYKAAVLVLYAAAVKYADAHETHDAKAAAAADKVIFTAWKEYLSMFGNRGTDAKGKPQTYACNLDPAVIYAAVRRTVKEGLTYARHDKADGTPAARMVQGIAADTVVPMSTFQKNVERIAAERILGFDGVVSKARSREISTANREKRDAVLPSVEPAADTTTAPATETTAA